MKAMKRGDPMFEASRHHRYRLRLSLAAIALCAALTVPMLQPAAGAKTSPDVDPTVISDWNATAVATIVVDAGKANAEAFLWYGFEQAAVYNAVVGITRKYELYNWNKRGPRAASPEAAAAAAAHRLLLHYFPGSQARLDAALEASLAKVADGPAEDQGVRYGERAADRIIALRTNDGRNAPITFDVPPGPGVWRPTPPTFTPFFNPWMGQVRPMMLQSPTQLRPGPPPAMSSDTYTREFNEVKDFGAKTGSSRDATQTETALFFSDTGVVPFQVALRDLAARHAMDISDTARLFAAVDMTIADSVITVWDSKYHYGFWRPITAINLADTDGNLATEKDETWEPLIPTPPYPDYVSGLTSVVGSISGVVSEILGEGRVDLNITSVAAGQGGTPVTRHYEFATDFNRDAINARVWSGIHFRTADNLGNAIALDVADWALDHYFQPA
jgi:hypothetical protein